MSVRIRARKRVLITALAVGLALLPGLVAAPARAGSQGYVGWDFGNGFGIGFGPPPSAHASCDAYWPFQPSRCRHGAHSSHRRRHPTATAHGDAAKPAPPPAQADRAGHDSGPPGEGPGAADSAQGNAGGGAPPGPSDE